MSSERMMLTSKLERAESYSMKIKLDKVISREMKAQDLSVTTLSKKTNIPRTTIHDWVNGRLPSSKNIHHLYGLADFFKISLNELLFDSKDRNARYETMFSSEFIDNKTKYRIIIEKIKE